MPSVISSLRRRNLVRPRHSLGQNFLTDQNVLSKILDVANLPRDAVVVEVGPGLGVLTRVLAERCSRVVAVEIDPGMVALSQAATADLPNADVLEGDILAVPLTDLYGEAPREVCHFVANLPYGISKPILRKLIDERASFCSLTVMVQKEVAERVVAQPGSAEYGPISIACHLYGTPHIAFPVSRGCFTPRPEVDSAVVHADLTLRPRYPIRDDGFLFEVVRAAFQERRKTLANSLDSNLGSRFPTGVVEGQKSALTRDELRETITAAGICPDRRGETLSVEEFVRLATQLEQALPRAASP